MHYFCIISCDLVIIRVKANWILYQYKPSSSLAWGTVTGVVAHKECDVMVMVLVMDVSPTHNIFNDIDKMSNLRYWKIFL